VFLHRSRRASLKLKQAVATARLSSGAISIFLCAARTRRGHLQLASRLAQNSQDSVRPDPLLSPREEQRARLDAGLDSENAMNVHAAGDLEFTGLTRPNGAPLRLNDRDFVAIDRDKNAKYEATYRPQALYNRANEGFHANNETFLLHEVATNLPIYRPDTGPTDFHLHLPPGGFQLVLVTSGAFTFDYDGRFYNVGPGAVMLQSAIVHRQLFYTWSGLSTEENLKTPQTVVPDPISMGYSGKFLEAFVTDPTTFPNPTIVGPDQIDEAETPRIAWSHPLHNRPAGAGFWLQDPLGLDALYKPLTGGAIKSSTPVYLRDIGIEAPSGHLVTGHIIATDPRGQSLLPKSTSAAADASSFAKGEVAIYRVIRGSAEFKKKTGESLELSAGDVVTAGKDAISLTALGENTQVLRLGLLKGMNDLRSWTPTQRDEIDGLAGRIITHKDVRPLRTEGKPVGYLYG
jgi:quercetin dioxygenase-like cupin family protein